MPEDKDLEKFQQEKLKAEIELIKSEKAKNDIERQLIEKEQNRPWFRNDRFIQAFFAGVVAVPLLWFFFKEIAIPIYQKDNVKLAYEYQVALIENEKRKDSLEVLLEERLLKDSLAKQEREISFDDLDIQKKEFEQKRNELIAQYEKIIEELESKINNDNQDNKAEVENLKVQLNEFSKGPTSFDSEISINSNFILEGKGVEYRETFKNSKKFQEGLPDAIVFHYTAGPSLESAAKIMQDDNFKGSAHIIIGRDGKILQFVPLNFIAWHAGKSQYNGRSGYNNFSIGIEFDNAGVLEKSGENYRSWFGKNYPKNEVVELKHKNESSSRFWHTYTDEQIKRAEQICEVLTNTFVIEELLGNDDIAPGRKQDPGPAFPLEQFQQKFLRKQD